MTTQAEPLTHAAFKPYGEVVQSGQSTASKANQGTANRYNFLCEVDNQRDGLHSNSVSHPVARTNVCIFSIKPILTQVFECKLLERHLYSSQMFIPIYPSRGATEYLVIVALGGDEPDLSTLKAFKCKVDQGVNYKAGCWHVSLCRFDN
jgi:ureidoglycolate lyase